MTTWTTWKVAVAVTLAAIVGAVAVASAAPAGSVVALEGQAEVQRAGETSWAALAVGNELAVGDRVRTLANSKMRLLFRDESVITLAASSELSVDEQVVGGGPTVSRFSLWLGAARAIVTERYSAPGAHFEMETPTAVAGVRGTGFIASHDPAGDATTVLGLFDTTMVRSKIDPRGAKEVRLGPGDATTIRRGALPLRPSRMPEGTMRGLTGATNLPVGTLTPQHRGPAGSKVPAPSGTESAAPKQQVIDQPVDLLKRGRKGVTPPPPPAPPPAR